MIREKLEPVLWLLLASVMIGAALWLSEPAAHSLSLHQPSIGCAAGYTLIPAPPITGGVGGRVS